MRHRVHILLLCTLSLTALGWHSALAAELEPFEASYAWAWHGMTVAVSTLDLEHREDIWVYRSRSEPRGIGRMFSERPAQESILRVTAAGTQPLSYKADDGTSSTARDVDVRFDWAHGHVAGVYEDTPVDMPTRPGLQDDLSVQIALMVDLLRGRPPAEVLLLDRDAVREYSYTREGEETLETPLGRVATVIYQSHKRNSPRVTRFWCAPAHGYIPVRVQQLRLGEVQWTMRIQSLRRN
ncbi:MAG TPA: DUF3108 domain-containing protein [Steroidobacteraceae bacterium]|jgi:hypothetical protein